MPEETPVVDEALEEQPPSDPSVERTPLANQDEEIFEEPLNAEEATLLVLDFLSRMGMRVDTPRKAVKERDNFVVYVDLREATATVHINADSREIVEYTITEKEEEPKPLPIAPKKIALILASVTAIIVFFAMFTFFRINMAYIIMNLQSINTDYLIIGAALMVVAGVVIWWRRRS
jgi:hypothetical protein